MGDVGSDHPECAMNLGPGKSPAGGCGATPSLTMNCKRRLPGGRFGWRHDPSVDDISQFINGDCGHEV